MAIGAILVMGIEGLCADLIAWLVRHLVQTDHLGWRVRTDQLGWRVRTDQLGWRVRTDQLGWRVRTDQLSWPGGGHIHVSLAVQDGSGNRGRT